MPGRVGLALRSCSSATSRIISSSRSRFCFGAGRDRHHDRIAAPVFGKQSAIGKLLFDAIDLRVRLVDLVDGDDDRNFRRAGVIDRLDGLRHDAIVGRDDQDHDIGDFGAAGTHAGKRFVARRIDENDLLAVVVDVISADVLRDAAGFFVGDVGERGWHRAATFCRDRRGP